MPDAIAPSKEDSGRDRPDGSVPCAFLSLSDACRVWGRERPVTPTTAWNAPVTADAAKEALARDAYRCRFCGYRSAYNLVHHANDLHRDDHPDNLFTCDPLCHGWQHLGDMPEQFAVIAYLPGLSPADVNHLQRTLMVALHCGGEADKAAARDVLNWAASHRDYVTPAWGSSAPAAFADALAGQRAENRELREFAFSGLALIYHPGAFAREAAWWAGEAYAPFPVSAWSRTAHAVMNPPV